MPEKCIKCKYKQYYGKNTFPCTKCTNEPYEGDYLVWFKDNSCQECYTKDDLIRLLEKDHIKPIQYIFNMSDKIIVDRDIHINIKEVC